jgi:CRISPR/Cas system-associated protein Cas7 (RAMP superfamily)
MSDLSLIDADVVGRAHFYREKAEEIRRAARLANSLDAVKNLLEAAIRFDCMAARAEKALLSR